MKKKINISKIVSDKVKYLHKDKLYNYSMFDNISDNNREAFRKAMSRLAGDGIIVKVGSKKFYKRGERRREVLKNPIRIKAQPQDRKLLRRRGISAKLLKSKLSSNLFWSNPNGNIPIDNVITAIINQEAISDLDFVRFNFGDDRVIEVFLENFNINEKPMIRDVLHV
jgi:hypothetical protein